MKVVKKREVVKEKNGGSESGDRLQAWATGRAEEAGGLPYSRPQVRFCKIVVCVIGKGLMTIIVDCPIADLR